MQDLTCDDCSLMNNENSTSVKTIDPCSLAASNVAYTVIDNTDSEHSTCEHYNNKYNGSVLRGIKLEDAQESSTLTGDYFKSQTPEAIKPETPTVSWPQTQSMFSRVCTGTRITTTATNQHQQSNHYQSSHTLNHNQSHHHPHHHHHQLLLHGSDDPLISHGADSVINDDDHSIEFKHLLTAVTNGQKQQRLETDHHHPHQQEQQQKHQQPNANAKQHHTQQSRLISSAASGLVQKRAQNGCSSLTKQQLKVKAGLMSAAQQQQQQLKQTPYVAPAANSRTNPANKAKPKVKKKTLNSVNAVTGSGTVKLRFHHQALPPEYLSHYEATQRQQRQNVTATSCGKAGTSAAVKVAQTAKLPPPKSSHENVRSWLQKIAEIQRTAQLQQQQKPSKPEITTTGEKVIQRIPTAPQHDANNNHQSCLMSDSHSPAALLPVISPASYERVSDKTLRPHTAASTTRKISYADLPYMGEITLNNSKPRRGRKPKKADICHLIYKNYGTIFADVSKKALDTPQAELATLQLESSKKQVPTANEEPLNLCLRDYQSLDLYSVSSGEGNCDAGEEGGFNDEASDSGDTNSNGTTPGDALTDSMLATNMKTSMPCLEEIDERKPLKTEHTDEPTSLLLRPVRAYYQKLLESGMLLKQNDDGSTSAIAGFAGLPIETIEKDNQIALKIPIPSGFFVTAKLDAKTTNQLIPLDYPEPLSTPSSIKSEQSFTTTTTSSNITGSNGCNGITTQSNATPQKRKRSAIFIPPMPSENATNPANEVSICKFKFTGGIKPTLQEKKMLSVDSDGNYRYYSGTGDKSMRGYEFFPRESLQQSGFLPGVGGAGAFLNATGEKISIDIPPPSADLSNELLQIPDSPTSTLLMDGAAQNSHSPLTSIALSSHDQLSQGHKRTAITSYDSSGGPFHRKKKSQSSSRRTMQREKLERTFKEKGFLIQTQQLESAEGATYCKFRQLKKFTRYLFRNWKDYLPDGQVLKSQDFADAANQHAAIESLLSDHGFDTRDTILEHNTQLEATAVAAAAEVLNTDVLPSVERV